MRNCPYCKSEVYEDSIKCMNCGKSLTEPIDPILTQPEEHQPVDTTPPTEDQTPLDTSPKKKKRTWPGIALLLLILIIISTQITFFTIQPIGAIPEGVTIVMLRGSQTQLFDSPDALCLRTTGKVTILCRAAAIGALSKATKITNLPYIDQFYLWSTNGLRYGQ
jgi:hypothetical protein